MVNSLDKDLMVNDGSKLKDKPVTLCHADGVELCAVAAYVSMVFWGGAPLNQGSFEQQTQQMILCISLHNFSL